MVFRLIQLAKESRIEASRVLEMKNWEDGNALHEAAKYNHVRVAQVLMEEDAKLACMLDGAGMSPLYLAIMTGSLDVAKALLRSSSSGYVDSLEFYAGPGGVTALHAAVLLSPEIIEDILRRKPILAEAVNFVGRIPLHYAAVFGHRDMVKQLLEHDPSTAYKSDDDGFFPIHVAAIEGNMAVVDQILHQCPDADELLDGEGKNFLHAAFQRPKLDVVKETISKRPHLRKLLNDQDNKGNTPLHTAVENGDQGSAFFLLRDKSVNVSIANHDGLTPLDLAREKMDRGMAFISVNS